MKQWTMIETTTAPDGTTLSLHEHDGDYYIRADNVVLMTTRQSASEEKLAEWGCAHLAGVPSARVLIGGLGFGFTLRAVLSRVERDAEVVVAEISSAVIGWNRNPALPLAADAMADPRVVILHQDVAEVIHTEPVGFDSILIDVDNGPVGLSFNGNKPLYDGAGVKRVRAALRPKGCAAIWSVAPDPAFQKLMIDAGFLVEVRRCRSRPNSGRWHTIFVGRKR